MSFFADEEDFGFSKLEVNQGLISDKREVRKEGGSVGSGFSEVRPQISNQPIT